MSFKINSLGSRIIKAERVGDAELVVICLATLIMLLGLSVSLLRAHFYLFAYGVIVAALPFALSLLMSLSKVCSDVFTYLLEVA